MATASKTSRRPARGRVGVDASERELCAVGDEGAVGPALRWTDYESYRGLDPAGDSGPPAEVFSKVRRWTSSHFFLRGALPLLANFINHGLKIRVDGRSAGKWLTPEREAQVALFIHQAILERVKESNLLVFIRANNVVKGRPPQLLFPERCVFEDAHGDEFTRYRVALRPEVLAELPLSLRTRYSTGEVTFGDRKHEAFNRANPLWAETLLVWKDCAPGRGLAWPALFAAFPTLAQSDSMEVGEGAYAFAGRTAVRQHKLGHEIKGGPKAGLPTHFYKKERGKAVKEFFKGASGFREFVGNFDHEIDVPWIDPKKYDAKKWETVRDRLVDMVGPLARIYAARGVTPDMANMLEVQCQAMRRDLRGFLVRVVEEGFGAKGTVTLTWKNDCFRAARLQAELFKFGTTAGFVSATTGAEAVLGEGAYPDEMENKKAELKNGSLNLPHILPGTGQVAGNQKPPASAPGGRPAAGE